MRRLAGALGLIRRRLGVVLGITFVLLPIGLSLFAALVGVPITSFCYRRLLRALTAAARERAGAPAPERKGKSWAGAISIGGMAAFGAGVVLLSLAVEHLLPSGAARDGVSLAAGGLASIGLGVAFAPLMFAPFFAADGTKGPLKPFSRSFQLAARMGPRRSAALGALVGGAIGAGLVGMTGLFLLGDDSLGALVLAAPFAGALGSPLAIAILADAFVELEGAEDEAEDLPVARRVRGLWGLLLPALLLVGAAFVAAALSPSPMRESRPVEEVERGFHGIGALHGEQVRRLPGTSVRVRTLERGVSVEADDGGGAGTIDARFDTSDVGLFVFEREDEPSTFVIAITDGTRWARTVVDSDGVRLDDGLAQRVFGRLGTPGLGALALGLLLLLWIAFSLGSELGTARTLDVPDLSVEGREAGLNALEGTLRIAEDSKVRYRPGSALKRLLGHLASGSLTAEGEAWVEAQGGAIRLRLPDRPIPVLEGDAKGWAGEHVVVLSRFAKIGTTGLRTSSVPWPKDGVITLGKRGDAARALVDRAVRRASWLAFPTLLLLGGAAAKLLMAL